MKLTGAVLVASDLRAASDEALRQGASLARDAGVPLLTCHVVPEIFGIRPLFPHLRELDRAQADRVRKLAAGALEEQVRRVLGAGPGRPEVRIEAGSPHATLLEIASEVEAGLIVVGREAARGPGPLEGVDLPIARHADCPVLVASEKKGDVVLAATDFSDPALPAVHVAQSEAGRRQLPWAIVHVVDVHVVFRTLPELYAPSGIESVIQAYRAAARRQVDELAGRFGPPVRTLLREGPAAEQILAAAEEIRAELLVIGTHGRSGLGRIALGSVAEGVLRGAECSMLVVRLRT
jgi:nucleotide-binding universal stress UspA family protein